MAQIVNVNNLAQIGRPNTVSTNLSPTSIRFSQVVTATPISFVFPQGTGTNFKFGIPQSMFVDNSFNNFEMVISVQGTSYSFPVPALSSGYYNLDAIDGDTIVATSAGVSSDVVEIVFYNYEKTPIVWYKNQTTSTAVTIADGADASEGSVADAAVTNPALNGTVIGLLKGLLTKINTLVVGTAVTIADGADVAEGAKADAAITNPATAGSVIAFLKGIVSLLSGNLKVVGPNNSGTALTGAPVRIAGSDGTNTLNIKTDNFGLLLSGGWRPGTPVSNDSGNVANANAVATLPAAVGKTTWITGFTLRAAGATSASVVTATITGLLGGTKSYTFTFPAGATTAADSINVQFSQPMPGSAANTAIVVTLPAGGAGNTNATATAEGFQF
jgi:hypothetical protein